MKVRNRLLIGVMLALAVCIATSAALSARKARMACDRAFGEAQTDLPYSSTRFVLWPSRSLAYHGKKPLGFRPGWLVSYVHSSGMSATGFYVNILGDIEESGFPRDKRTLGKGWAVYEGKLKRVAELESFIQQGVSYSNLIATLGPPQIRPTTNNRVVILEYFASADPPALWGTNGFTVRLTNNVGSSPYRVGNIGSKRGF